MYGLYIDAHMYIWYNKDDKGGVPIWHIHGLV